jgi:hypothetical protein
LWHFYLVYLILHCWMAEFEYLLYF